MTSSGRPRRCAQSPTTSSVPTPTRRLYGPGTSRYSPAPSGSHWLHTEAPSRRPRGRLSRATRGNRCRPLGCPAAGLADRVLPVADRIHHTHLALGARLESDNSAQVDARDVADRHEYEQQLAARAAARNAPRAAHVDDRLGEEPEVPHDAQMHVAAVRSTPKTSIRSPAIALPSSAIMSGRTS